MTRFDASIPHRLIEYEWDGRRRGVAVLVQVAEHLGLGDREAIGDCVKDALIGLMEEQPVDVLRTNVTAFQ